jgi:hypothetical protein
MISYQHSIYYRCQSTGVYRKVASIFINSVSNTLGPIFSVMNGQPAGDGMRVRYFFNPMSLRSMSVGDIIEVNGKAYRVASDGYQPIEYRKDHEYECEQVYYDPETGENEDLYDHFCATSACAV